MNKFKVGDRVIVSDGGYIHGTFRGFYDEHKTDKCYDFIPHLGWIKSTQSGVIMAMAPYGDRVLCLVNIGHECIIINQNGLTLNAPPRNWKLIIMPDKSDSDFTNATLYINGKPERRESVKRNSKDTYDIKAAINAVVAKMNAVEPAKPEQIMINGTPLKKGSKFILKPYEAINDHHGIAEEAWNKLCKLVLVAADTNSVKSNYINHEPVLFKGDTSTHQFWIEIDAIDRILED